MNISRILESGGVTRFHSNPNITPQTISDHSWGVSVLCHYFNPNCSKELILAALTHDCSELETGDIPAPVKWNNEKLSSTIRGLEKSINKKWDIDFKLSDKEKRLLKLCDMLEGMNYCLKMRKIGQVEASEVFYRWAVAVKIKFKLKTKEQFIYNQLLNNMSIFK